MSYHLVVHEPFGPYQKGDMITAADAVALVLASPQHPHVVKINAPDAEPAPVSAPPPAAPEKPAAAPKSVF